MGLASLISEARAVKDSSWAAWARGDDLTSAPAGVRVDAGSSLQVPAVYGCVSLISETLAASPLHVYRERAGGRERLGRPGWLDGLSPLGWRALVSQIVSSMLLHGNAFVAYDTVTANGVAQPSRATVLAPSRVTVRANRAGGVDYDVDGQPYRGRLVHMAGMVLPGAVAGLSPIQHAAVQEVGLALALQEFGTGFFARGQVPSGVLSFPGEPPDVGAVRDAWTRSYGGVNRSHLPVVLWGGARWDQMSVAPEHAQFLESRQFTASQIAASIFKVPPDMVGFGIQGQSLTYQNLEQRWTQLTRAAVQPPAVEIETKLAAAWLPRGQYMKFNLDAWARADLKTRYEAHKIGLEAQFLDVDEVRAMEDLPPREVTPDA